MAHLKRARNSQSYLVHTVSLVLLDRLLASPHNCRKLERRRQLDRGLYQVVYVAISYASRV